MLAQPMSKEGREARPFHPAISTQKRFSVAAPSVMPGCDRCCWRITGSGSCQAPQTRPLQRFDDVRLVSGVSFSAGPLLQHSDGHGPASSGLQKFLLSFSVHRNEIHPARRRIIQPTSSTTGDSIMAIAHYLAPQQSM